jgi:hypothetical protein
MELDESFHNAPPRFITITLPNVIMNLLVNPKNFNPLLFLGTDSSLLAVLLELVLL